VTSRIRAAALRVVALSVIAGASAALALVAVVPTVTADPPATVCPVGSPTAADDGTCEVSFPPGASPQPWVVPAGVTSVDVITVGGGGGGGSFTTFMASAGSGGGGGQVSSQRSRTPWL